MKFPVVIVTFFTGFLIAIGLFLSPVFATSNNDFGLLETASVGTIAGQTNVPALLGSIAGSALSLIGIIFFALMIYGGLRWMFSMGSEENSQKALQIIFSAIIGLLIVMAAYAITQFVFISAQGGGSSGGGSGSSCSQFYTKYAMGCFSDEHQCDKSVSVKTAFKDIQKGSFSSSSAYKVTGICPGGTDIVCCVPKEVTKNNLFCLNYDTTLISFSCNAETGPPPSCGGSSLNLKTQEHCVEAQNILNTCVVTGNNHGSTVVSAKKMFDRCFDTIGTKVKGTKVTIKSCIKKIKNHCTRQ